MLTVRKILRRVRAGEPSQNPARAQSDAERELSAALASALAGAVRLGSFPKASVDVFCVVLEADGGELPAAAAAAALALADAGIEMGDLVAACAVVRAARPAAPQALPCRPTADAGRQRRQFLCLARVSAAQRGWRRATWRGRMRTRLAPCVMWKFASAWHEAAVSMYVGSRPQHSCSQLRRALCCASRCTPLLGRSQHGARAACDSLPPAATCAAAEPSSGHSCSQ